MLEDDFPTALGAIRDGSLTVTQWLKSIRGVRESHWFAPDDPMLKAFTKAADATGLGVKQANEFLARFMEEAQALKGAK